MDEKIMEYRRIKILNEIRLFFCPTKHVERIEMWKKMGEGEEAWVSKVILVTLMNIEWKEPNHDALVEFMNIFVIIRAKIYFARRDIMYVIGKQIIANAF